MEKQNNNPAANCDRDMQQLIGNTLRAGVTAACLIACIGGLIYLVQHGGEPMKDYSHFSYDKALLPEGYEQYTTLHGILAGVLSMSAVGWIQLGVIALLLTPIMRVVLSWCDFYKQRDWLYVGITSAVLAVILYSVLSPLIGA